MQNFLKSKLLPLGVVLASLIILVLIGLNLGSMKSLPFLTQQLSPIEVSVISKDAVSNQYGLRLCNKTDSQVGIAIGLKHTKEWKTEGWWNLTANECQILLEGDLIAQYYYVYAIDYERGGEWGGNTFMCTREKEFVIEGVSECVVRGYEKTGFFEVDTGIQKSWTVQLTEPVQQGTGGR